MRPFGAVAFSVAALCLLGPARAAGPVPPASARPTLSLAADPEPEASQVLPISLDTVLRLAEENNAQVRLARERVREACAARDRAACWLPDVYAGPAYWRHEGGIQNEDGTLTHSSTGALFAGVEVAGRLDVKEAAFRRVSAERRRLQEKGECSRITSEKLLDAATTYLDLLAARTGEMIVAGLEKDLQTLLDRAEKQAAVERGLLLEAAQIRGELQNQRQALRKLREQAASAAAKLAYLLDLDPCVELLPVDEALVPFELVNASAPVGALVARVLTNGPGVQETERLLALVRQGREGSVAQMLPAVEVRMAEGAFGAGPGARSDWDNRWDLAVQARWNLTELARSGRGESDAQAQQAYLSYQDLRGRLTAGVREAREAALSAAEQIGFAEEQVRQARRVQDLANERLRNQVTHSHAEVLLAAGSVAQARLNYLNAVRAFDRAELRLLLLLGPDGGCPR
jgi:outer membrane protein TolC